MRRATIIGLAVAAVAAAAVPAVAGTPAAHEFSTGITANSGPSDIAAGPDGNLWFTELAGDRVGRITPSGTVTEFSTGITPGSGPRDIAAGPDGNLWFTEFNGSRVGRITPTGSVTEFSNGITAGSGPVGIAAGPDGNLWFTETNKDQVARITPTGTVTEFSNGITANSNPSAIAAGPDGNLWFTEANKDQVARITPTGAVTEFSIPPTPFGTISSGIAAGPDGNLWFTEFNGSRVGRITPSGTVTEFPTGITQGSSPSGIAAGPDGNLWFSEANGGGSVARITPTGTVTEFSSGITPGSHPFGIAAGPDGNLWFTETEDRVGSITTGLTPPRFSNPARIEVPAAGTTSGPANPYPSTIEVQGLQGTVTNVTVGLNDIHHASAADIEAELVAPGGQSVLFLEHSTDRIGDANASRDVLNGEDLTFSSNGVTAPRWLTTGIFTPTDSGFALTFPPPAPTNPSTTFSAFNGTAPDGSWKLYVTDDPATGDFTGVIAGGWSLDIQTTGPAGATTTLPGPAVPGPAATTPGRPVKGPTDRTKPALTLRGLAVRTHLATFRRGVLVRVTASEPVTLDATLAVGARRATKTRASFPRRLAERTMRLTTTARSLRIRPRTRLLGHPRTTFRARLRLVATDKAGNHTTITHIITVLPDRGTRRR